MKPIKLNIKGINSFIDEQIIDFEKLTECGIFGIFGPTGSGKSSILDAMTLALYDEISRNTREFINKEVDKASVYFEFSLVTSKGKRNFVVERGYKKNKEGITQTSGARLYETFNDGKTEIIAEKTKDVTNSIIDIIGLNYNDFTRSVVLPQGKFSEFLSLKNKERRDMLERIFHLEKYGKVFTDRVNRRSALKKSRLNELETRLEYYEDINEENLELNKKLYEDSINKISDLKKQQVILSEQLGELSNQFELRNEFNIFKEKLEKLDERKVENEKAQMILNRSQDGSKVKPFIDALNESKNSNEETDNKLILLKSKYEENLIELDKAEKLFQEISNKKINLIPELISKKESLKNALDIEKDVAKLEQEIMALRKQYIDKNTLLNEKIKINNDLNIEKQELEEKLKFNLSEKEMNNVDSWFKKNVQQGSIKENSLNELIMEYEKGLIRKDKIDNRLKELSKEIVLNKEHNESLNIILNEALKNFEELECICPGTQKDIIEIGEKISREKSRVEKIKEDVKKSQDLLNKIKVLEKEVYDIKLLIENLKNTQTNYEKSINELNEKMDIFKNKNMAAILARGLKDKEPCPVCGSCNHPSPAETVIENVISELENDNLELLKSLNYTTDEIKSYELQFYSKSNLLEHLNIEYNSIEHKDVDVSSLMLSLSLSEENYNNKKKLVFEYEENKLKFESEITDVKEKISLTTSKIDSLMNEYNLTENSLIDINNDLNLKHIRINEFKDDLKILKDKIGANKDFKLLMDEISEKERRIEVLAKDEMNIRSSIEKNIKLREVITNEISQLQKVLETIKVSGNEKKNVINSSKHKIYKVSEGRSLTDLLTECENNINDITNEEKIAEKLFEDLKNKSIIIQKELAQNQKLKETYENMYKESLIKVNNLLENLSFNSINEVLESMISDNEFVAIKNNVDKYNKELVEVNTNISRLEALIDDRLISEDDISQCKLKLDDIKSMIEESTRVSALCLKNIEEIQEKIVQKKSIIEELDCVRKDYSILEQLSNVTKGNAFVEYIASSQLEYITVEASKRLKQITNGRYALELDGSNFIMRDDFNGGTRREPSTLSGGEVFLTSFSLAIALSSKIQMKNSAPLEFFFLDEGFGTLDAQLLDTVMNSLENLQKDKLSVGVITHVEELKNRIPIKLIVNPAKQGVYGSKVRIDYN